MTLVVLLAVLIARIFEGNLRVTQACLWYVAIQVCLSYLIAGVVKLKGKEWRDGSALSSLLTSEVYEVPRGVKGLAKNRGICLALSWGVILFELLFPLALLSPESSLVFMGLGFLFHAGNAYVLGLNRFLWAWSAAYPALYLCSLR